MDDKQNLIGSLAHWVAAGKLEAKLVIPAIRKLAAEDDPPESLATLLAAFEGAPDEAGAALALHLRAALRKEALRFYERRKTGLAIGEQELAELSGLSLEVAEEWKFGGDVTGAVSSAIWTARDFGFLVLNQEKAPNLFREVKHQLARDLATAGTAIAPQFARLSPRLRESLYRAWPESMPGREAVLGQLHNQSMAFREAWLARAGRILKTLPAATEGIFDEDALLKNLESAFSATSSREDRTQFLDCVCSSTTPAAVSILQNICWESWAQNRAIINLTLRFGQPNLQTWEDWLGWLSNQARLWRAEEETLHQLIQNQPQGLLLILYSQLPDTDPAVPDELIGIVCASVPAIEPRELIRKWTRWVSITEQRALLGLPMPQPPPIPTTIPPIIPQFGAATAGRGVGQPPPLPSQEILGAPSPVRLGPPKEANAGTDGPSRTGQGAPSVPRRPSIWQNHIQPFFVENWYIVAGIAMVILGSSLLAYYTWDKHWLVRYTIMPALLALFTWSLAGVGRWIEKKGSEFKGTAAILRGAAIGLLPINFMAMALLSADEKVPQKGPAMVVMGLIYLSLFGWGLRRWCAAVEPALGNLLGGTLLLLNALVAVGPLARTVGRLEGQPLLIWLGAGFYVGFLVTAGTIVRFTQKILTREMAEEKRVPWFMAAALAITFIQVFVWVHGFMRHLPHAHTYALMVIMTGWLVLYSERRALELRGSPQSHGGESFLGFAMIMLGLLMGFAEPRIRIVSFMLAGAVWMYQAFSRRHPLHYWIALTLWALGGASVGLLPDYPGRLLPLLGVVLSIGFGLGGWLVGKRSKILPTPAEGEGENPQPSLGERDQLAQACLGMQVAVLVITAMVAPLAQWHFQSAPLATAGWLVIVAALFAWRALKDQKLRWLHASMVVMALVLPYAGCMDMAARTAHHNTMVFGLAILSLLWLGVTWAVRWGEGSRKKEEGRGSPAGLILQARSTVLWFYGSLAVAAMLLRVVLGDTAPDPAWLRDYMDYTGPILMMIALIPATYYSRSVVPAGMAVGIMAILFPELKANLQETTPWLSWGTGLGSAVWGLALVGVCFFLRQWTFLRSLPEGDRFMGRELFPFRRHDHTLFTLPILAAALFLIIKVDTWTLLRNQFTNGVQIKTAIALGITGIAWTVLAIYRRQHRGAIIGVHLGWISMLAGISFGYWREAADPHWSWPLLIAGLLFQGLYWFYRFGLEPARAWAGALLAEPMRWVLMVGSTILAVVSILSLDLGTELERIQWLYLFLAAQLVWHALRTRNLIFGTILFFQIWIGLLAITAPGTAVLWERVSIPLSLSPTLWLLLGIQVLFVALEQSRFLLGAPSPVRLGPSLPASLEGKEPAGRDAGAPSGLSRLLTPSFVIASGMAFLLGLGSLVDGVHALTLSPMQQGLLLATLLLTARAHVSGLILLPAMFLGYLMIHRELLAALGDPEEQVKLLATPWRLALLGLGMVLITQAGRAVHQRQRGLLAGPFAQPFFTAPSCGWIFWPATLLAVLAEGYHTLLPALRDSAPQLWAPYVGAITCALVACFWRRGRFFAGAGLLLALGNIHLVRVFSGDYFRGQGLSEVHLICLGFGLSLLQATALRLAILATSEAVISAAKKARAVAAINLTSLGVAGCVLVLLSANYFTEPNLASITRMRFIVAGLLAWLAGQYFRRAARHPGPGEEAHVDVCEALYHFGVVLSLWCAALLVEWFRQPFFTLIAIALPVAYFYARAEFGSRTGLPEAQRYRNTAAVLGFIVLALYVFKGVFHVVLFPGVPISTEYYHYNAPLIMLLGIVLLRLHGLGGTGWLAFYGGLALMTGSFFLLTALPGFSPFKFPMPSAWCALGLGHFWILLSYARSPLRTWTQRVAKLDDQAWNSLRQVWGGCLLVGTQGAVFLGILDYGADTYMVAPLLAGAATIFIHQGMILLTVGQASRLSAGRLAHETINSGESPGAAGGTPAPLSRAVIYLVVAALELIAALHTDFLIPSYLTRDHVIWAILAVWLVLLATYQLVPGKLRPEIVGQIALILAAFALAHVCYHRPWSNTGLWGMALGTILAAWNPQRTRQAANAVELACAAVLLWIPCWLVYFSQAPFEDNGLEGGLKAWPVLVTTTAFFLTGIFARLFPVYLAASYAAWPRSQFRLFDSTLTWLQGVGPVIHRVILWLTLAIACAVQVLHYKTAFATREVIVLTVLEAALAVAWFYEGKGRESMLAYYLMQIAAVACFGAIRRHLMLTTSFWNYEYDIWASLVFSFALAGAKQVFDLQPRALKVPLLTTMVVLPGVALVWVVVHHLGVNLALLVVGLHSVMFAYLGKDDRESPYNILALGGFVAFILVTFYSKLHLMAVHAYVIPVGLGVLVLQELFRQRINPAARNWIRLVTLMAMLGSAGYYALADSRHAITFNLTMILLSLLAMGLGGFLRIRLYLALGFAGLMVDLVSILYKVLVHMERSARMTIVGILVLAIGAILVFGATHYRTPDERKRSRLWLMVAGLTVDWSPGFELVAAIAFLRSLNKPAISQASNQFREIAPSVQASSQTNEEVRARDEW